MESQGEAGLLNINLDEQKSLLCFLRERFNLDFRDYLVDSVHRRLLKVLKDFRISKVEELIPVLNEHPEGREHFLDCFTVNVTDYFRDPEAFRSLRDNVFPAFSNKEEIHIWLAGCSTGEEVLSVEILLHEMGLLDRCRILATDISGKAIARARRGEFLSRYAAEHELAYHRAGGLYSFDHYLNNSERSFPGAKELLRRVEWRIHDLTSDKVHRKFDLIICRNVLIYFKRNLQNKVLTSLSKKLPPEGYIMQGSKESLILYSENQRFREVSPGCRIYQKQA